MSTVNLYMSLKKIGQSLRQKREEQFLYGLIGAVVGGAIVFALTKDFDYRVIGGSTGVGAMAGFMLVATTHSMLNQRENITVKRGYVEEEDKDNDILYPKGKSEAGE